MTKEMERVPKSGWAALIIIIIAMLADGAAFVAAVVQANEHRYAESHVGDAVTIIATVLIMGFLVVMACGFVTLQPNTAAVLTLFGAYKGTARREGFSWVNPFVRRKKISLRARTLNGEKLKVNDQRGNPIEIAAVVVWRVSDTARATFEVDDYLSFVSTQSETSLRHLATMYPYDSTDDVVSLRRSMDEVSKALRNELQERLAQAGVIVEEARLSHLAYAQEIAGAMLRRQQAEAIVAARSRIVEGACGMVQMALEHLKRDGSVELDPERTASMVSNLLVVLCSEQAAQPVVNTGTLYH